MWFKDANILNCGIDVLGDATRIGPSPRQGQTVGATGRCFPPSSRMMFMFWNDLFMMIYYWILDEWWNNNEMSDWILDDCRNDYKMLIEFLMNWDNDENVNVLKWLVWGGYIIALRWILNWLWDGDWTIMNLGCWRMVVWVLRRIYRCILLNVIVTNGCMSITKDLPSYFIECNCDKWLYGYYDGSTVVLYWM
jgi:hypothetical protein